MNIKEFIKQYKNYPILFWGTGMSLRYLQNSYTWEKLLEMIAIEIRDEEYFLELKGKYLTNGVCDYAKLAQDLEKDFEDYCHGDRNGKFKDINDKYFENIKQNIKIPRLKLYIAKIFNDITIIPSASTEIAELKKAKKNISSIITTNYDCLIEKELGFKPLVGNDILLSNPYGAVYKIHGSSTTPSKIILTQEDYDSFNNRYELIRAQLLSLFIHHPIIFIGYSIADDNIKSILKTIFNYVEVNSEDAKKIRNNFLLIEYEKNSTNEDVVEHDIELDSNIRIRINKLKTDKFSIIYNAIEQLSLPVSVMDIRKVQNIVKEIYEGGDIKVSITDNLDELPNSEKILAIGKKENIYIYKDANDMMIEYFYIIENRISGIIKGIEKLHISSLQFFPVFGFDSVCSDVANITTLKKQQRTRLVKVFKQYQSKCRSEPSRISDIQAEVAVSGLNMEIAYQIYSGKINLDEAKQYILDFQDKKSTDYRRLLTAYDYKKYAH